MKLSISQRLVALVAATALGIFGMTVLAWTQMNRVYEQTNFANVNTVPSYEDLDHAAQGVTQLQVLLWQHIAQADQAAMDAIESQMGESLAQIRDALAKYEREDMDEPPAMYVDDKAMLDADRATLAKVLALREQVVPLSRQNRHTEARDLMMANRPLLKAMNAAFTAHVKFNTDTARSNADEAAALKQRTALLIGALGLLTLVLVAGIGYAISRSILTPLQLAVAATNRVAAGDLTVRLDLTATDELGTLLAALSRMQGALVSAVGAVRVNAEKVATGSLQIAQGNQNLSGRTEQQASSLEQTAAAMEQLTATVKHGADHAARAHRLAQQASDTARQGGQVMGDVVETMQGINHSAQKIGDIIGVIDGLAFQTNILALNAAVEAARAGEQGQGFAVVAGEVRRLAQRSADAAREIKALINDSIRRVDEGGQRVHQAGDTMQAIVAAIAEVSTIVGEMSNAAVEQRQGMAQIAAAVTHMDQATQENSALVEESAAAADSLQQQARALVGAVSLFKLGPTATA